MRFVVENKPGAGGNIGADAAAKAAPVGYTILMGARSTHAVNPPTGTPRDIVQKWNADVVRILDSPEMRERLAAQGAEAAPTSPEQFGAFVASEARKYARIVKVSGAKVD